MTTTTTTIKMGFDTIEINLVFSKKGKNQARKKVSEHFFCLYSRANPRLWTTKKELGYEHFYF